MDAPEVVVEAHLANGLPSFTIVGLPEAEVKESGRYDLPIALGILAASGQIPTEALAKYEIAG